MPAPPARSRSASVPCGVSSTSSSPCRNCRSNSLFSPTYEEVVRAIRLADSRTPRPHSSMPQLFETTRRPAGALLVQGADQHARDAAQAEAADRDRGALADVGDGLGRTADGLVQTHGRPPARVGAANLPRTRGRPRASVPRVSQSAGYSGTPLPRKLGIAAGATVLLVRRAGGPRPRRPPGGVTRAPPAQPCPVRRRARVLPRPGRAEPPGSRPGRRCSDRPTRCGWRGRRRRRACRPTSPTTCVREVGLAGGLVDVKVCAIDAVWSGLKLVYRLSDRSKVSSTQA